MNRRPGPAVAALAALVLGWAAQAGAMEIVNRADAAIAISVGVEGRHHCHDATLAPGESTSYDDPRPPCAAADFMVSYRPAGRFTGWRNCGPVGTVKRESRVTVLDAEEDRRCRIE